MVARPTKVEQSSFDDKGDFCETSGSKDPPVADQPALACRAQNNFSDVCLTKKSEGSKRKGDLEFEMQMDIALSATAVGGTSGSSMSLDAKDIRNNSQNISSPSKRMKTIKMVESRSSSQGISTAFGSQKIGAPLYWAEVYCSGENLTGKWVHVDAVNAIIDGEQKVEPAVAACKTSLRYAIAFAGLGAKDVTRRFLSNFLRLFFGVKFIH
ncbi:hypothetical protein U1Q18_039740 [Sarracenia purpurea var. burkii]